MAGRFLPQRDLNVFERVNKELIGDLQNNKDGIINQQVVLYKVSVQDTQTNMYGEAAGGKRWKDGVKFACLVDAADFDWNTDEFGPDAQQSVTFSFLKNNLIDKGNIVIEVGDIIEWNYAYFEVDTINENRLIGGDVDQNWDVIASTHMTRQSKLNIVERQR